MCQLTTNQFPEILLTFCLCFIPYCFNTLRPLSNIPQPTPNPTASPSNPPSNVPTPDPTTAAPTPQPTASPSNPPSNVPTPELTTAAPTPEPTAQPVTTPGPTSAPTNVPTVEPTPQPTAQPVTTPGPTSAPTNVPTSNVSCLSQFQCQNNLRNYSHSSQKLLSLTANCASNRKSNISIASNTTSVVASNIASNCVQWNWCSSESSS